LELKVLDRAPDFIVSRARFIYSRRHCGGQTARDRLRRCHEQSPWSKNVTAEAPSSAEQRGESDKEWDHANSALAFPASLGALGGCLCGSIRARCSALDRGRLWGGWRNAGARDRGVKAILHRRADVGGRRYRPAVVSSATVCRSTASCGASRRARARVAAVAVAAEGIAAASTGAVAVTRRRSWTRRTPTGQSAIAISRVATERERALAASGRRM